MPAIECRIVEVCAFKLENGKPRYLLLKRAENEKLYPGIWQIVSGMMEKGEHAVKAALREFHEETGLTPKRFWVVPFVNSFYVAEDDTVHLSVFFAVEVAPDAEPLLSDEHQAFVWHPYEKTRDSIVWPGQWHGVEIVHDFIVSGAEASKLTELNVSQYL